MAFFNWTDDRVETLKKLWESGLSASQIAAELGGCTRNAVIGKIHRMGLSGRAKGHKGPQVRKIRSVRDRMVKRPPGGFGLKSPLVMGNAALSFEPEPEAEFVDNIIPMHQRLTLLELTDETCKWPVGDPQHADFHFCGGRAVNGMPYCAHHCRLAYQPASEYRRKKS